MLYHTLYTIPYSEYYTILCIYYREVGAPEQIIKVERLELPTAEERLRLRSSQLLDVMEV